MDIGQEMFENKLSHMAVDIETVSKQLQLLQDFIKSSFCKEFKEFLKKRVPPPKGHLETAEPSPRPYAGSMSTRSVNKGSVVLVSSSSSSLPIPSLPLEIRVDPLVSQEVNDNVVIKEELEVNFIDIDIGTLSQSVQDYQSIRTSSTTVNNTPNLSSIKLSYEGTAVTPNTLSYEVHDFGQSTTSNSSNFIDITTKVDLDEMSDEDVDPLILASTPSVINSQAEQSNLQETIWVPWTPKKVVARRTLHRNVASVERYSKTGLTARKATPFECPTCKKHFAHQKQLHKHKQVHALYNKNPLPCTLCDMTFFRMPSFKTHLQQHNRLSAIGKPLIFCPMCPTKYLTLGNLYDHMKADHSLVPKEIDKN